MKGLVITGFTVVEALGSGQGGILYLARDAEGREAVIRVARDGEDNVAIRLFIEEARQLLPSATDVETTVASDGRRILMARATPVPGSLASRPPVEHRAAPDLPGGGFTRYAATEKLPSPESPPPALAPSRAPLVMLLAAQVVFGAGASMGVLAFRSPSRPTSPAVARPVTPDAGRPVEPVVAVTPSARPEPAPVEPAPEPPAIALVTAPVATAETNRAGVRPCIFDSRWRRAAESDLGGYRRLAASLGPDAFADFEDDEDSVARVLATMEDGADCRALDARLEKLTSSWDKRLAKHRCTPDASWRSSSEARLAKVPLPESERAGLIEEIRKATDWADCLRINQRLASRASVSARPGAYRPPPGFVCEPTEEWKKMMFGNLAMLEGQAARMKPLEVEQESMRVGKLVNDASDHPTCLRAIEAFEDLKSRAME
jgi:hypothetical protein